MKQTYLVTGAAGFIGSQFVQSCQARQSQKTQVISVDHPSYFVYRTEHLNIPFGTLVDRADLFQWFKQQPQSFFESLKGIVHLGAIANTQEKDLDRLNQWNLEYSKNLWKIATEYKIPFVYASSAATYGDGSQGYDDDEGWIPQLKPLNAYGESKQKFDLWALEQEAQSQHPPSWAGFKFFNVYGPGERHKKFMSSVVLHAFDEIKKHGYVTLFKSHREGIAHGYQKRDFIYVQDVIDVLHFALENPIRRGIYNLGTGQARPFMDLAQAVFDALGHPMEVRFIDTPVAIRDKYQYFTQATMYRLRAQGYTAPFTSLEEGVKRYIEKLHAKV